MKQKPKGNVLHLDDKTITLLARAGVQAMFDMVVNGKAPAPILIPTAPLSLTGIPEIGQPLENGSYGGLTIHDNIPMKLVLLPGDESMPWNDAVKWAEKQGGVLPSRFDLLVLFKNLRKEFKGAAYWSVEQYEPGSSFAWCQNFGDGYQSYYHKGYSGRVRAVRRLPI